MCIKTIAMWLILFAATGFGQAEGGTADSFAIASQPDSPVKLSYDRPGPSKSSALLKVTNNGAVPLRGYVLRVKGIERDHVYTEVFANRLIEPGASRMAGISSGYVGTGKPESVEVSLDYVAFKDGTSWGTDSLGRSKVIADYVKGHETAKAKLAEMLAGQDGAELIRHVEMWSGHTFGEPASSGKRDKDYFDAGYQSVLTRLRQKKGPREDEAKELARRLELMQKTVPR